MQDKYVGDIGDFGKYALLNALAREQDGPPLKLGVVWYRVPDEHHLNDGKFISYLSPTPHNHARFRACDPELYDALAALVSHRRTLEAVRDAGVFPGETRFFEPPLHFADLRGTAARQARRAEWNVSARVATTGCDLIFADPDNGLEAGTSATAAKGPKYVYLDELVPYAARDQSLVIYHHTGRQGSADAQIAQQAARIRTKLPGGERVFTLRFHRGSSRVYFVVPSAAHHDVLRRRAARFLAGPWKAHFSGPT